MARRLRLRTQKRIERLEKSAFLWSDRFSSPQNVDSDPEMLASLLRIVADNPGLLELVDGFVNSLPSHARAEAKRLPNDDQRPESHSL